MAKKKDNYLDYIPRPNTLFECNKNKDGKIEIKMHNKGVFNKIAQVLFKNRNTAISSWMNSAASCGSRWMERKPSMRLVHW